MEDLPLWGIILYKGRFILYVLIAAYFLWRNQEKLLHEEFENKNEKNKKND